MDKYDKILTDLKLENNRDAVYIREYIRREFPEPTEASLSKMIGMLCLLFDNLNTDTLVAELFYDSVEEPTRLNRVRIFLKGIIRR